MTDLFCSHVIWLEIWSSLNLTFVSSLTLNPKFDMVDKNTISQQEALKRVQTSAKTVTVTLPPV